MKKISLILLCIISAIFFSCSDESVHHSVLVFNETENVIKFCSVDSYGGIDVELPKSISKNEVLKFNTNKMDEGFDFVIEYLDKKYQASTDYIQESEKIEITLYTENENLKCKVKAGNRNPEEKQLKEIK